MPPAERALRAQSSAPAALAATRASESRTRWRRARRAASRASSDVHPRRARATRRDRVAARRSASTRTGRAASSPATCSTRSRSTTKATDRRRHGDRGHAVRTRSACMMAERTRHDLLVRGLRPGHVDDPRLARWCAAGRGRWSRTSAIAPYASQGTLRVPVRRSGGEPARPRRHRAGRARRPARVPLRGPAPGRRLARRAHRWRRWPSSPSSSSTSRSTACRRDDPAVPRPDRPARGGRHRRIDRVGDRRLAGRGRCGRSVFSGVDRLGGGLVTGVAQALLIALARRRPARDRPDAPPDRGCPDVDRSSGPSTRSLPPPDRARLRARAPARRRRGCPTSSSASSRCPAPPVELPDRREGAGDRGSWPRRARCGSRRAPAASSRPAAAFVVAPGYVVTNAHVVAGGSDDPRDRRRPATSTRRRSCSIRSSMSRCCTCPTCAPALRFAGHGPEARDAGAVLGYPGGGPLRIVPRRWRTPTRPRPRHLRTSTCRRDILELRAEIERGDSGGPLVLRDGTVGGLVFAEARTDHEVGYALARPRSPCGSAPRSGRTEPVETGDCLRP